ncbi:Smr/MutS family protein [Aureimonas mangrovi]|uniref:Smr/MutS family protein n=1 Tax=Aureimonas mangrovi TaxID=2758041 RepID=UPI00163D88DE|nr:Smr/MutS family protein [Aureimonas mangrovi]
MRRRRQLSAEEKRLWGEIARTARPLPGKAAPDAETAVPEPVPMPVAPLPAAPKIAMVSVAPTSIAVPGKTRASLPLHPIERPVRRRLGKGRIPIDDRIDLHGRTEAVAHTVLLGFLRQAQARGLRHVLVITGRGASFGSQGTLKRALPHWLHTGEFRTLVAGFEPAERAHGGEGAFYLRIRRR